jgi:hypothetical protein
MLPSAVLPRYRPQLADHDADVVSGFLASPGGTCTSRAACTAGRAIRGSSCRTPAVSAAPWTAWARDATS